VLKKTSLLYNSPFFHSEFFKTVLPGNVVLMGRGNKYLALGIQLLDQMIRAFEIKLGKNLIQ